MKTKKITINIPTNWEDITIGMYQQYLSIVESNKSDEQKNIDIIKIFCNISDENIKKISIEDIKYFTEKISGFLNKKEKFNLQKVVNFKNKKYGFIPNLNKITTGEYVDIETYSKDSNKNLHKIISVLYREVENQKNEFYNIKSYDPDEFTEQEFKDFPMSYTLAAIDFFFVLGQNLLADLNNYLMAVKKKQGKGAWLPSGVGII